MESHFKFDPKPLGTTVLSRETIVAALRCGPTDFINRKHISCNVDLSPLVKEEELNYLRLRYNEYLLQYATGPVNLENLQVHLGQREEEAGAKELELEALRDEMAKADMERRHSTGLLAQEAQEHHLQVARLEQEMQELRNEIRRLQEGGFGAGALKQMNVELDCAIHELEHLEFDVDQRLQNIESLESKVAEKDGLLANTRSELESILTILDQIESNSAKKMHSMNEAIVLKESQLSELHLQIEALNTCMQNLKNDLQSCQDEAELLKNSVMEKNIMIENFTNDNTKIVIELESLKSILSQSDMHGTENSNSSEEHHITQDRIEELEKQLKPRKRADEEAKCANKTMAAEIEGALKILDVSTIRVEELIHENEALKYSIADLECNRANTEITQQERSAVRRVFKDELDIIVDYMKKNNGTVSPIKSSSNSQILNELEAADQTLMAVENMLLKRGTAAAANDAPAWKRLGSRFVRYYPLLLTILFFILVIRVNIFCMGSWNLWLPYFLFSALSFTLPHPFGAIASLLAAFVVAASFFV
ncbi:Hypothetical predicted protein [Cloeon dipterum]|uniref:Uncharacterized protein n=1 Tax=Cloeon dipterum TaxID=197152 RepID=A0A8S1DGR0_9INSE|nr:Hypothetical predicted protein [Cloeon dipterum]